MAGAARRVAGHWRLPALWPLNKGQSSMCIGLPTARSSSLSAVLTLIAALLQGCELDIPRHVVGNWRAKESYLVKYGAALPGNLSEGASQINSCMFPGLAPALRCSGHGECANWFTAPTEANGTQLAPLSFCRCDEQWTGPECNLARKSQVTAYLLSMTLGMFGADQFYLGWWGLGCMKLATFGGLGLWWVFDVVRIGSTPVATAGSFRLANDLAHWAFVLTLLCFAGFLGFALSIWSIRRQQERKAREILLLRSEMPVLPGYGAAAPFGKAPRSGLFRGYAGTLPPAPEGES